MFDRKEYMEQYNKNHPRDRSEYMKQYQIENKEKLREYYKQYYAKNREIVCAKGRIRNKELWANDKEFVERELSQLMEVTLRLEDELNSIEKNKYE